MAKTGARPGILRDGREVFLNGKKLTTLPHPAYKNSLPLPPIYTIFRPTPKTSSG